MKERAFTFTEWLARHTKRDSPLGDFAGDVARDRDFPRAPSSLDQVLSHLIRHGACGEAQDAAKRAWRAWIAYADRQAKYPIPAVK